MEERKLREIQVGTEDIFVCVFVSVSFIGLVVQRNLERCYLLFFLSS